MAALLLATFFALDCWRYRGETQRAQVASSEPVRVRGAINFLFLALIIASTLISAEWKPGVSFDVYGTKLAYPVVTHSH